MIAVEVGILVVAHMVDSANSVEDSEHYILHYSAETLVTEDHRTWREEHSSLLAETGMDGTDRTLVVAPVKRAFHRSQDTHFVGDTRFLDTDLDRFPKPVDAVRHTHPWEYSYTRKAPSAYLVAATNFVVMNDVQDPIREQANIFPPCDGAPGPKFSGGE